MSFNEWLANKLGNGLSSVWFFYFCVALDLVELVPVIQAHDVIVWCSYISQTVIQLIALPILGYQQKVTHKHHERNHEDMKEILTHVRDDNKAVREQTVHRRPRSKVR